MISLVFLLPLLFQPFAQGLIMKISFCFFVFHYIAWQNVKSGTCICVLPGWVLSTFKWTFLDFRRGRTLVSVAWPRLGTYLQISFTFPYLINCTVKCKLRSKVTNKLVKVLQIYTITANDLVVSILRNLLYTASYMRFAATGGRGNFFLVS